MNEEQIEGLSEALGGVGRVVAPFVPTLGGGFILASTLLGALGNVDKAIGDGSKVIGLGQSADILEDMMINNSYNDAVVKDIIKNIRSVNSAFSTMQKIIN